jgi:hypothetical protein
MEPRSWSLIHIDDTPSPSCGHRGFLRTFDAPYRTGRGARACHGSARRSRHAGWRGSLGGPASLAGGFIRQPANPKPRRASPAPPWRPARRCPDSPAHGAFPPKPPAFRPSSGHKRLTGAYVPEASRGRGAFGRNAPSRQGTPATASHMRPHERPLRTTLSTLTSKSSTRRNSPTRPASCSPTAAARPLLVIPSRPTRR